MLSRLWEEIRRDLRYAVRALGRAPTFLFGVVMTFALVIGANAAIFGLVARLMLSPPPGIRNAERVAQVLLRFSSGDATFVASTTSYPTFRSLRSATGAFSSVAASRLDSLLVGPAATASPIAALGVSGEYFQTLGASPTRGRVIDVGDDALPA